MTDCGLDPLVEGRGSFDEIEAIHLSHGQALWVLSQLGFSAGVTAGTFNYYIKSLRKLGVPFKRGEYGLGRARLAKYSFNHLMELSVALSIRVYGILPDVVVRGLTRFREDLYTCYRKAYLESGCGSGAPIFISAAGCRDPGFSMRGVYLDLQLTYAAGQLSSIGPPQTLKPFEALAWLAQAEAPARAHPPLNLSQTAVKVAELMKRAPRFRRGPKPRQAAEFPEAQQGSSSAGS